MMCWRFLIDKLIKGERMERKRDNRDKMQEKIDAQYRKLRRVDKGIARSKKVHGETNHSNRRQRLYVQRERICRRIENLEQSL